MSKKRSQNRKRKIKEARRRRVAKRPRFSRQLAKAGEWPLLECLISQDWRTTPALCQIAVARQSPNTGEIVVGGFIVDLACLGVKNALTNLYPSESVYRREYRQYLLASQPMMACDLDLAAKVIEEGTNYALSLGFKPHKDAAAALRILGDAHPENRYEQVPLGHEGKPLFVKGPYDDARRIIRILDRSAGPGNYDYIVVAEEIAEEELEDDV